LENMKDISEATSKQLEERKRSFESVQTQFTDLQTALEKAWIEIADLKKVNASSHSKAQDMVMEAENKLKVEYQQALTKHAHENSEREASLLQTIKELRASIARNNERAGWKEDELQSEIQNLKAKIQASQGRNEEIVSSVPEATRPLLRQIEIMQSSNTERMRVWEELEKSLTQRLNDAEERAQNSVEKERSASSQLSELAMKMRSIEYELSLSKSSNARVSAEVEMERIRAEDRERELMQLKAQLSLMQSSHERVIQELKQNEYHLQSMLNESKEKEEKIIKELQVVTNQKKQLEKDKIAYGSSAALTRSPSASEFPQSSFSPSALGTLPPMEKYQSIIKQKDGEISALQSQNQNLDKSRAALQEELVRVTSRLDQLTSDMTEMGDMKLRMDQLNERYNTALQLIGEKEEQVEELKHDIEDMKLLYKSQISELLR